MSSNSANSILRDVAPGCETGIYYIPIANLPFGTSWHELKDWLRCACAVEHVEIFNSSTSGWVRVKGKDNFDRALCCLVNGEFGGRKIIAASRNATERIKIKELVDVTDTPMPASSSTTRDSSSSMSYGIPVSSSLTSPPSMYPGNQWPVGVPASSSPQSSYGATAQAAVGIDASTHAAWYGSAVPGGYDYRGQQNSSSQLAPPQYDFDYNSQQFSIPYDMQAEQELAMDEGGVSEQLERVVITEQRKIIVKHLGHSSTEDQLRKLVKTSMKTVTSDKNQLQHIEFPRAGDGRLRGHIFATFKTAEVARGVVQDLNGKSHQKRTLDVRLTNEGVSQRTDYHRTELREEAGGERNRDRSKRERRDRGKDKGKTKPRDKENVCLRSRDLPGHGASSMGSGRDQGEKPRARPIIVDGSTRKSSPSDETKHRTS